jgi:hypothetical protein
MAIAAVNGQSFEKCLYAMTFSQRKAKGMSARKNCCGPKARSLDSLLAMFSAEIQRIQGMTSCAKITILSQEIVTTMKSIVSKQQHVDATAETLEKILRTLFDIETALKTVNCPG